MRKHTPRRIRGLHGFVYWMQARRKAAPTITNYSTSAKLWVAWCEENEIDYLKATRDDILFWLSELAIRKAQSTVRLRLISLRVFYEYLQDEGYVKDNPAKEIDTRKQVSRPVEPYTPGELQRMLQACRSYQERATLMVLAGTGLRRSEIHRISRADCNFIAGTIRVLRKGNQYQMLMPEPSVMLALEQALEFNDRLFTQGADDIVDRIIKRLAERANIPGRHHPHRIRYTFAVAWCESGAPESELMENLGHSSMTMTNFYSKAGRQRRAMRTMQGLGIASRLLGPSAAG